MVDFSLGNDNDFHENDHESTATKPFGSFEKQVIERVKLPEIQQLKKR